MTRFAEQCRNFMNRRTKELETVLGPSTGELTIRIGLNSGAITAGVLRGEKGRFQLFGDTVNVAARLEGSGRPQMIHASASTADQLHKAGKAHWVSKREDPVTLKGKGEIQTFWVQPAKRRSDSITLGSTNDESVEFSMEESEENNVLEKNFRLVQWNTEILCPLLARVVAQRSHSSQDKKKRQNSITLQDFEAENCHRVDGKIVLDEMTEILPMPEFDGREKSLDEASLSHVLTPVVKEQMQKYVLRISA
eukprot:scaffold3732_cov147-Amphora_coffeaeformis.AAC.1